MIHRDSDALFAHFNIRPAGVHDLQLMELAARPKHRQKNFLTGLANCIKYDGQLSNARIKEAAAIKDKGIKLFDPNQGVSYTVFDARPLSEDIKSYCVQDVQHMPKLWTVYRGRMSKSWWEKVPKETKARVHVSQRQNFEQSGENMASAPVHWAGLQVWSLTKTGVGLQCLFQTVLHSHTTCIYDVLRSACVLETPFTGPPLLDLIVLLNIEIKFGIQNAQDLSSSRLVRL